MLGNKNISFFFFLKVVHNHLQSTGPDGASFTSLHWMMLPCGAAEDRHGMVGGQTDTGAGCLVTSQPQLWEDPALGARTVPSHCTP